MHKVLNDKAHKLICSIQDLGLMIIALATIVAMGIEVSIVIEAKAVHLADLLLLFIYLEVLSMVSIYLDSGELPVRIPLYIAIVALARYLILDMKNMDTMRILGTAGATFVIAATVLLIRYGQIKMRTSDKMN
jgi:protein PsiE